MAGCWMDASTGLAREEEESFVGFGGIGMGGRVTVEDSEGERACETAFTTDFEVLGHHDCRDKQEPPQQEESHFSRNDM